MGPLVVDAGDVKPLGASIARSYREGHDTIRVHADDRAERTTRACAVCGRRGGCRFRLENFGDLADHLIAVQPAADLINAWDEAAGPLLERLRAL